MKNIFRALGVITLAAIIGFSLITCGDDNGGSGGGGGGTSGNGDSNFFVKSVSVGSYHTLAIKTDGSLWAWGSNYNGLLLGYDTTTDSDKPVQIGTASDWKHISAGSLHSLAIKTDGSLWAWGDNYYGQLGDDTTTDSDKPVQIGTATDWEFISAGGNRSLATKTDGSLWAWGHSLPNKPERKGTATDWEFISAGGNHSLAIKTDGSLWTWWEDDHHHTGIGSTPERIGTATDWKHISVGDQYFLAIKADGSLWAWEIDEPVQIGTDTDWKYVSAGWHHTLAIKTNGSLWAWGDNHRGQLGNGTTTTSDVPVKIGTDTNWDKVFAGLHFSLAIKTNGSLWAWGYNELGQLGDGTNTDRSTPVLITGTSPPTTGATGTFQIRINGIPASIMLDGMNGYNLIGLYTANGASLVATALAGRDTTVPGDDDFGGAGDNQWWSFYMYNNYNGQKHIGPAGNYDMGFIVRSGGINAGTIKVLRNVRLEVNTLNTFAYSSLVDF